MRPTSCSTADFFHKAMARSAKLRAVLFFVGRFRLRAGRGGGRHVWQPYIVLVKLAVDAVGPPYMAAVGSRKCLRKGVACGRRKILRRCAPLNDKFGGSSVLLSFRAQRGIFVSADAIPRLSLPLRGRWIAKQDGEGMSWGGFACGRGTLPTAAKYPKRRRVCPDPRNGAFCSIGPVGAAVVSRRACKI